MKHIITLIAFIALSISPLFIFAQNGDSPEKINFIGKAENLGTNINSEYSELAQIISPDGKTLYFCRIEHPSNIGGENDLGDIWVSELDERGKWKTAYNIGKPLNDKDPNAVLSITPDGNTVLLLNTYGHGSGVSMSHRTRNGWSIPKKVIIDNFYFNGRQVSYFLANDNKTLLMSVERDDTEGELDLYVSFLKDNDTWSEPMNLGTTINSKESDFAPFLASDSKTLFFASEGHGGYGEADIFMSLRLDDTWTNWSEPVNLGEKINTKGSDAYFSIPASGDYAYFVRYSETNEEDIFRIRIEDTVITNVLVSGFVYDKRTHEPLQADIRFEKLSNGEEAGRASTNPNTGEYKITLPCGEKYGLRAICDGYIAQTEVVDLSNCDKLKSKEKRVDIYMIKECGEDKETFRINVFFDKNSSVLKKESMPDLKRLVDVLNKCDNWVIQINGYTCDLGSDAYCRNLSIRRAKSVYNYLVSNGISKRRLKYKGYGKKNQICTEIDPETGEISEECRKKNRRVEIEIRSKKKK